MINVSLIIPVYNTEKYLRVCLDSVIGQTLTSIEIICINDASTDSSLDILNEYAKNDTRIKITNLKENKGAAVARNTGIKQAQGEYIGFIDSDDFIDLDFYEKLYNRAIETDSDITKSNLSYENNPLIKNSEHYCNLDAVKKNKINFIHIPTSIFKSSFLKESNVLFPENLKCAEDSVFEVKIAVLANKIELVEEVFYHYVWRNNSLNNSETYSKNKLKEILNSVNQIFDFLSSANIDKESYLEQAVARYKYLTQFHITKCEDELSKSLIQETAKKIYDNIKYVECFKKRLNPHYDLFLKIRAKIN